MLEKSVKIAWEGSLIRACKDSIGRVCEKSFGRKLENSLFKDWEKSLKKASKELTGYSNQLSYSTSIRFTSSYLEKVTIQHAYFARVFFYITNNSNCLHIM